MRCLLLAQTRPLSVLMREPVQALRAWARERCVRADQHASPQGGLPLSGVRAISVVD